MKFLKYIGLSLFLVMIVIQFIRPAYNLSDPATSKDFANAFKMPENIKITMQNACYDCHSNSTRYLWYFKIQPIAWLMQKHITNGKQKLNLSEFGNYPIRRQISKLKGIANSIKDDEMPLSTYKLMHEDANLPDSTKLIIIAWVENAADSLSKISQ